VLTSPAATLAVFIYAHQLILLPHPPSAEYGYSVCFVDPLSGPEYAATAMEAVDLPGVDILPAMNDREDVKSRVVPTTCHPACHQAEVPGCVICAPVMGPSVCFVDPTRPGAAHYCPALVLEGVWRMTCGSVAIGDDVALARLVNCL
jgi:hypothetical protein